MRKALLVLTAASIAALSVSPALASVAVIPFVVTETDGTAHTVTGVTGAISNATLQSNGYIASDGLNAVVAPPSGDCSYTPAGGGDYCPTMIVENRTIAAVPSIAPNGTGTYQYQLGYDGTRAAMEIVPGYGGYITIPNAAALQPGSGTWEIAYSGYVDSSAGNVGQTLVDKDQAVILDLSAEDEVRGRVYGAATTDSQVPSGDSVEGSWTAYNGCTSVTQYQCVSAANDAKNLQITGASNATSYFTIPDPGLDANDIVTSVEVRIDGYQNGGGLHTVTPFLRIGGDTETGAALTVTSGSCCDTETVTIARPGGGDWTPSDFASLLVGGQGSSQGGSTTFLDYLEVIIHYAPIGGVVTRPIDTDVHMIRLGTGASDIYLSVDEGAQDTTPKITVNNVSTDWVLMSNASPYLVSYYYEVAGTAQAFYHPTAMISGTTLPDASGQGHPGTFTYGTNPSGVSVTLGPLAPSTPAAANPQTQDPVFGGVTISLTPPANYAMPTPPSTVIPGVSLFLQTDTPQTPIIGLWIFLGFGGMMIAGFVAHVLFRDTLYTAISMGVVLFAAGWMGFVPLLWLVVYGLFAAGFIVMTGRRAV